TAVLVPLLIIAGWNDARDQISWGGRSVHTYFALTLAVEGMVLMSLVSLDVLLFYVFFEAMLIPMYFLIGGFGGENRAKAAVKFLLYNLFGGLVMLAAVIGLYVESAKHSDHPSYLISDLAKLDLGTDVGRWLFLGFMVAFVVKAPLFPVHTW